MSTHDPYSNDPKSDQQGGGYQPPQDNWQQQGDYGPPQGGFGGPQPGPDEHFFAFFNGTENGPMTANDLRQAAANGALTGDAPVRTSSGQQIQAKQIPGVFSHRDWLTAVLLSFFLGGLGVDRFYLGQTGLGVVKLITCGGCGVWSLIDFILLLLRKLPDVDGKALA